MSERKGKGPHRLGGVLRKPDSELAGIRAQAERLTHATHTLNAELPPRVLGHWQVAQLSAQALVVVAESATWATYLRSHQAALLARAGELLGEPPQQFKIRIAALTAKRPRPKGPRMSAEVSERLSKASAGMSDPRLAEALKRLASRRSS